MIDLGFKDKNGTIKYLSDFDGFLKTTPWISGASGKFVRKVVKRDGIEGSFAYGEKKIETGKLKISFEYCNDDYALFLTKINEFLFYAQQAEYIVHEDTANSINRQIKVSLESWDIPFNPGGMLLDTSGGLSFMTLNPYWEDVEYTETSKVNYGINELITVTNGGNIPVRPIIEVDALRRTTKDSIDFIIYVDETKEGIRLENYVWGSDPEKTIMYIDCEEGTIELSGKFSRTNEIGSIYRNSSFFSIPPGEQDLYFSSMTFDVQYSPDRMITIKHKNRYMV